MIKTDIILSGVREATVSAVFLAAGCADAGRDDTARLTLINEGCP